MGLAPRTGVVRRLLNSTSFGSNCATRRARKVTMPGSGPLKCRQRRTRSRRLLWEAVGISLVPLTVRMFELSQQLPFSSSLALSAVRRPIPESANRPSAPRLSLGKNGMDILSVQGCPTTAKKSALWSLLRDQRREPQDSKRGFKQALEPNRQEK